MNGKPRNLASLSKEEMKDFLNSFDTIVSDCDGVIWMPGSTLPRCDSVIKKLRELGKKILFFSNNSYSTRNEYMKKFEKHGIEVEKLFTYPSGLMICMCTSFDALVRDHSFPDCNESEVILPPVIAGEYLKSINFQKKVFLIGSSASQEEIESFGIRVYQEPAAIGEPGIMQMLEAVTSLDPEVGAVVMDVDVNISYIKMMKAVAYLKDPNCLFLVTATEYKLPFYGLLTFIGPGFFSDTVTSVSGKKPIIMGKPSVEGGEYIKKVHSIVPERTLMIGDTISHDIGLATNCGFLSLFVLSGVNTLDDIEKEGFVPDYYISSLSDLGPLLP